MDEVFISSVPQRMALVAWRSASAENLADVITTAFAEVDDHIESGAACGDEERIVIYPREWGSAGEHEIGVAVVIADGSPGPGIRLEELPGCKVVKTVYYGPYAGIREGWGVVWEWMDEHDLVPADGCWEVYRSDPADTAENHLETELMVPLP